MLKNAQQKNDMQKNGPKNQVDLAKALPKNRKAFEKEITLLPDTSLLIRHGKNSKRLIISAKTEDGKVYHLKYKKVDNNQIRIKSKVDSMMKLKITVMPKEPLDNERWYRTDPAPRRSDHRRRPHRDRRLHVQKLRAGVEEYPADRAENAQAPRL